MTVATGRTLRIGIIGGGISGLSAAYYCAQAGASVTVFEGSDQLGGLGSTFEHQAAHVEKFYHCMLPTDKFLLDLLTDLHLSDEVSWKQTSFAMMSNQQLYPLNNPFDLLRYRALGMTDRLRVGLTGLWGSLRSSRGLDDMTCEQWLTGLSGQAAFDSFWKPMLQAKFGDRYKRVPALWFWTRFNREKGAKVEQKGYLPGGYRRVTETLAESLAQQNVQIRTNSPVDKIKLSSGPGALAISPDGREHEFDRLIFTGPIARLNSLISPADIPGFKDPGIDMQGVINAVLVLKRPLTPHYWVATVDKDVPFQGIVETSHLFDESSPDKKHLVYLMNYVHRDEPAFTEPDQQILADYLRGIKSLFPDLSDDDISDARVFRSPFVEPLYTVGYQQLVPPPAVVPNKIYLATTAQVYPDVTSWNGSVGLSRRVVSQMLSDAGQDDPQIHLEPPRQLAGTNV